MKTIYEIKINGNNNESAIKAGVYQENDGSFTWVTLSRSGNVKSLKIAFKKIRK